MKMTDETEVDFTADLHELIPGLGDLTGSNDDVHLTDADMNDPELLRELHALISPSGGVGPVSSTPISAALLGPSKHSARPMETKASDLDLLTRDLAGMSVDEEVHVEVTDADMNDHSLLNELYSLTGAESTGSAAPPVFVAEIDDKAASKEDDDLPLEYKLKTTDVELLKKYIQLERVKAATRNRAGDKVGARESFAAYKQLERRLEALTITNNTAPIKPATDISTSKIVSQSNAAAAIGESVSALLKKRITQYKQAAVHYKRQQDMTKAKEMLAISKRLEELEEQASLGIPVKQTQIPAEPVLQQQLPGQAPALTIAPATRTNTAASKQSNNGRPLPAKTSSNDKLGEVLSGEAGKASAIDELERLRRIDDGNLSAIMNAAERQLKYQIDTCTTISAYYFKAGDKPNALQFHKYKKAFAEELSNLEQQQKSRKKLEFELKLVQYAVEKSFLGVGMQDIQLEIIRGIGLSSKEVSSSDINAYVSWDFGWPTEGPAVAQGKGDTETKKSMDPEFNWKKLLKIDRNKVFQRFLERRKATFDVYHYRGFLRKSIMLGRAIVKLDDLLNSCEIHEFVELVDPSNRRPTGGKLEIRIRLRQPLLQPEIITKSERWLFLGGEQSPATAAPVSISIISSPAESAAKPPSGMPLKPPVSEHAVQPQSQIAPSVGRSPSNKSVNSSPTVSTAVSPSPAGNEELDNLKETFENIDLIVSNNVLEFEERRVSAEIEAQSKRKATVPEELTDRKQQLEIKMQLLVLQVQTGKLTMEMYLGQVRQSIAETKRMALAFKRLNELDWAKRALARAKIMQDEFDEASAAQ